MSRFLALLFALSFAAPAAHAQLGIGGQVGSPTGLSLKFGSGAGSVAVAVGWDLNDSVSAEAHYLFQDRRPRGARSSQTRVFYGPGAWVETNDSRTRAGLSLGVGLGAFVNPDIEIYGIASPRLQLTDETAFRFGGGVGLRLYI